MTQPPPSKAMLVVSLVFAVVLPPLGFILGVVARAQLGSEPSRERRLATVSVAISSAIMGVAFLIAAVHVILVVALLGAALLGFVPFTS